jgi:hypothetical protein
VPLKATWDLVPELANGTIVACGTVLVRRDRVIRCLRQQLTLCVRAVGHPDRTPTHAQQVAGSRGA